VSALERKIDELYALPLSEFTAARNALAKTLKGDDAAQVKRLEKPSVVAWSVNQLYWVERRTFDKLLAAGRDLRAAQIAALKGKSTDLRASTSAHRAAVAAALAAATRIAGASGVHPAPEPLSRMLEALSLAQELPAPPGRFTDIVQPAGFEALAGITPSAKAARPAPSPKPPSGHHAGRPERPSGDSASERRRAEAEAAARKAAEAARTQASRILDRARAAEARAQAHADTVREQLSRADTALAEAKRAVSEAERELVRTEAALQSSRS
jgi:hypothetical protein